MLSPVDTFFQYLIGGFSVFKKIMFGSSTAKSMNSHPLAAHVIQAAMT